MTTPESFKTVLATLDRVSGPDAQGWYTARCPFHDDALPSLRLTERGFHCMGCTGKSTPAGCCGTFCWTQSTETQNHERR